MGSIVKICECSIWGKRLPGKHFEHENGDECGAQRSQHGSSDDVSGIVFVVADSR